MLARLRLRLLPVTIAVMGLALSMKLIELGGMIVGHPHSLPIADAHAEQHKADPAPATEAAPPADGQAAHGKTPEKAGKKAPVCQPPPTRLDEKPMPSPQEVVLLQQLASRREELDARSQELERRADLLQAAENRLDRKLEEMKTLEATLQQFIRKSDEQQEAKLRSLVKIYENMKPKDAARIFEQLDGDTLLPVAERMNERKLAPVMAEMNPSKAKEITVQLAKLRKSVSSAKVGDQG